MTEHLRARPLPPTASFGSLPKPVLERMRHYQNLAEAHPDRLLRYDGIKLLNESRALLAEQLNVPVATIVMILNATTGINLVLRNLQYRPEDTIVYFSTSYGACQNIVLATMEFTGCMAHRIELEYPMSVSTQMSTRSNSEGLSMGYLGQTPMRN